ncbi:hypothetical protein AN401_11780 [Zobellella denitrificans]|uniref:Phage tail protein n=1 Tax=Zobellella denitrificans TaxID=347534 RepID=A0A291HQL5_9GAMM|nr:putative phage tail protein [Zobellella denitrificans]ATG74320.1 hypothetical protein AN401_10980 [Zobellella denitrificans]ATG74450.1 hypothetical protein AN401_11780 [Zobellella denitrificans]
MAMTAVDYQRAALALLPPGAAWSRDEEGTLGLLLLGLNEGLARVDADAARLVAELVPERAFMLLEEWEAFAGLPECDLGTELVRDRQAAVAAKLTMTGSLNANYYRALAAGYGYDISLSANLAHHCLRDCLHPLYPDADRHRVYVNIGPSESRPATCLDHCLVPLQVYEAGELPCLLDRYKPAHKEFIYVYEE